MRISSALGERTPLLAHYNQPRVLMSQRAEHLGDKYTFSHLCISINRRGALQNSSDLDVGRRPELKKEKTDEYWLVV